MKKVLKYGIIGLLVVVIASALFGGDEETVSTGSNTSESTTSQNQEKETTADSKTIDATAQKQTIHGLEIGLGEIKITKDKIKVGMNLKNTGSDSVTFYPDQGNVVIGSMQLDANLFLTEGDVSGDIMAGVEKEGVIEFLAPEGKEIDVETLTEVKFLFGDVTTADYMNSDPANFTVTVE